MPNPFPFVANSVLQAAQLNGIGEATTSFTPTWGSTGTAPAIGNGTLTGKYTQVNKLVFVQIFLQAGTTTTAGTGTYTFTLPVTGRATPGIGPMNSAGLFYDASANASYNLTAGYNASTSNMRVFVYSNASQILQVLGLASPATIAATDEITLLYIYEAA